jgi:Rhodopirellula transposase DDE domain/Helix-turn-helix of DDE superfamily endonuclease
MTSHEVIVASIAATTTRAGLSVQAELDTGDYPTGIHISDARMAALPIARHTFHSDWNYTLHPQSIPAETTTATGDISHLPPPDTLSHPAFTGMTTEELTALTTALHTLRAAHREGTQAAYREALEAAHHNEIRPHAPRSGRPQTFGFPDRVLATVLHLRLSLPEDTLAHLFTTSRSTIRRAIHETRQLLDEHRTTITAAPTPPRPVTDLLTAADTAMNHP